MNILKYCTKAGHRSSVVLLILSLCLLQSACSSSNNNSETTTPNTPSDTNQSKSTPTLDLTPYLSESKPAPFDIEGVKFYKDVPYKKNGDANQKFDFYMPESKNTTSLVIFYHGGGFIQGDKDQIVRSFPTQFTEILKSGIAVASVDYRFIKQANSKQAAVSVEAPLGDMRYFLQFARYYANSLNIDASRIILSGESAGASTALLIGLYRDEIDINAKDPILRESMEVKGLALWNVPASMNINEIMTIFPNDYNLSSKQSLLTSKEAYIPAFRKSMLMIHGAPKNMYISNARPINSIINNFYKWIITPKVEKISSLLSVKRIMTTDDPELWIANEKIMNKKPEDANELYHHPAHAKKLHEWADNVKLKHQSCWREDKDPNATKNRTIKCYGLQNKLIANSDKESMANFVKRKLKD